MSGDTTFKKFVTEAEVKEIKLKRQEEWDKVRKPDQPVEAPEEVIDNRSLYERLEEQKAKKQETYDEQHDLKNLVRGLDDEEAEFLDKVSQRQLDIQKEQELEERELLAEYKNKIFSTKPIGSDSTESVPRKPAAKARESSGKSQKKLLSAIVKKKDSASKPTEGSGSKNSSPTKTGGEGMQQSSQGSTASRGGTKRSASGENVNGSKHDANDDGDDESGSGNRRNHGNDAGVTDGAAESEETGALKVIGILPGIGPYSDSSGGDDSDDDSSSGEDCTVRKQVCVKKSASGER